MLIRACTLNRLNTVCLIEVRTVAFCTKVLIGMKAIHLKIC